MNNASSPIVKHLVLIGGGHSHLAVLKYLGMHPVPGLAVTLISREINTPYSGSMPGYISGIYKKEDMYIDLRPLAQFAGAQIIQEEIEQIDLDDKRILCQTRPHINFDIVSLNIGSKPNAALIPGASEFAIGIKPIDKFLERWQSIKSDALAAIKSESGEYKLNIIGGGPASIEFAFAAKHSIHKKLGIKKTEESGFKIQIFCADDQLLQNHNAKVKRFVGAELAKRNIEVKLGYKAIRMTAGVIEFEEHEEDSADSIVFATGASIPAWPAASGLELSENGFISVNSHLQSTSHPFVFAAGDAATIVGAERPKSGVYAVRQGKPLAENLLRYATGRKLKRYNPQKHALALISMGNKSAIASRNKLFFQGRSIWSLKNSIDSAFLRKYSELPKMEVKIDLAPGLVDKQTEEKLKTHAMRCAGCGAKVAGDLLADVLAELPQMNRDDILTQTGKIEDASLIKLQDGRILLQSIDQLKAFINDPFIFAKVATNHCLSDIHAMGCEPHSALAVVGIPFADKAFAKQQLTQLMLGCSEALQENDCPLIGGHTAETSELQFGLCVNGFAEEQQLLTKHGMRTGDCLILTKPIGTGTLLAADMRCQAKHDWIDNALQQMLVSNRSAAACLVKHNATACTDVTGFGLAGHLIEMLTLDNVEVEFSLEDVPILDGALETLQQNIFSSLHQDNRLNAAAIYNTEAFHENLNYEALFDPQTAGGLLASVPAENTDACVEALRGSGYPHACVIGRVSKTGADLAAIILK